MTKKEEIELLKTDVKGWNAYKESMNTKGLKSNPIYTGIPKSSVHYIANLDKANLSNANLTGADLTRVTLRDSNLTGADLTGADLEMAFLLNVTLTSANLTKAYLSEAIITDSKLIATNLTETNFTYAKIENSDLSQAYLLGTIFLNTILKGCNFNKSILTDTIFAFTSLQSCLNVDNMFAEGPSSIDFNSLQNSNNLSIDFLVNKIGLPDNYVEYFPDFYAPEGIRLHPVFLSHSSKNKDFTTPLYESLLSKKCKVWYDQKKLKPGDNIERSISQGINLWDMTILVCSEESLSSWWVQQEINRITTKERNYQQSSGKMKNLLIPITIDDTIFKSDEGWADTIRSRSIGDFREWKDNIKFESALNDLVDAINVDRRTDGPESYL